MDSPLRVSERQVASSLDARVMNLILLPTEQCNFRCTYCYEDFAIGQMTPGVILGVERLLERRIPTLKHLQLSWFGGEPLAAKGVLLRIARHAHRITQEHGVTLQGGLTTNGSLINAKLLSELYEVGHSEFQITLDGDKAEHDLTRVRADGSGTFDKIWRNLLLARDFDGGLHVMLRLHVTGSNTDSLLRLLERCDSELMPSGRFSIHFHRVSNLGGPGGGAAPDLSWSSYKNILGKLSSNTRLPSSSEVALSELGEICYAAKPNSLLIRADGRVGKCTVALNDPRNDVGRLDPDGNLQFIDDRLQLWFEGFSSMQADVLGCPLAHLGADPEFSPARLTDEKCIDLVLA